MENKGGMEEEKGIDHGGGKGDLTQGKKEDGAS